MVAASGRAVTADFPLYVTVAPVFRRVTRRNTPLSSLCPAVRKAGSLSQAGGLFIDILSMAGHSRRARRARA